MKIILCENRLQDLSKDILFVKNEIIMKILIPFSIYGWKIYFQAFTLLSYVCHDLILGHMTCASPSEEFHIRHASLKFVSKL